MERWCRVETILFMSRVTLLDIGHVEVEVITDPAGREGASRFGLGASRKCLLDSFYVRGLWKVLGTGSGEKRECQFGNAPEELPRDQ